MAIQIIVGSHTDVGKTVYGCNFVKENPEYFPLKPVITGYDENDMNSDTERYRKSIAFDRKNIARIISPWRYRAPISPNIAIAKGRFPKLEMNNLVIHICQFYQEMDILIGHNANFKSLSIETVGGVCSPITSDGLVIDFARKLVRKLQDEVSIIFVTRYYVGSISHTLTALRVCKDLPISEIQILKTDKEHDQQFLDSLIQFGKIKIVEIREELLFISCILK